MIHLKLLQNSGYTQVIKDITWVAPLPRMQSSPPAWHYMFRFGDPEKKTSFATVTGSGDNPIYNNDKTLCTPRNFDEWIPLKWWALEKATPASNYGHVLVSILNFWWCTPRTFKGASYVSLELFYLEPNVCVWKSTVWPEITLLLGTSKQVVCSRTSSVILLTWKSARYPQISRKNNQENALWWK